MARTAWSVHLSVVLTCCLASGCEVISDVTVRRDFERLRMEQLPDDVVVTILSISAGEGDSTNVYEHVRFTLAVNEDATVSSGWLAGARLGVSSPVVAEVILLYQRADTEWRLIKTANFRVIAEGDLFSPSPRSLRQFVPLLTMVAIPLAVAAAGASSAGLIIVGSTAFATYALIVTFGGDRSVGWFDGAWAAALLLQLAAIRGCRTVHHPKVGAAVGVLAFVLGLVMAINILIDLELLRL
ncbi:MAG TPA: hypothetical protein VEB21_16545 [Terriglobales bacterium]|nr:hypothetical protein [Terriglobales bacterium]